jgi:hypothetical protein
MQECLSQKDRMKAARARHRHGQREAAASAGVSINTWLKAEVHGRLPSRADSIARLAAYVGCDPGDLIAGEASASDDAAQADAPVVAGSQVPVSHGR